MTDAAARPARSADPSSPVLQRLPLGRPGPDGSSGAVAVPWPTIDPFLFCVHHLDRYPAGDGRFGPAASLAGRDLGQDFAGIDGWRMYHGLTVPGFPQHPHRGFETVTYARQGFIDHSDSLGAAARFGRGDVQWLTAGGGIVHAEMFPLLDEDGPNTVELFQIWLNLPSDDKLAEPHFSMLWDSEIPRVTEVDDEGRTAEVTVIAGELAGHRPPAPPPRSWASRPDADVAIWHVHLDPGASFVLPPAPGPDTARTVYVFDGAPVTVTALEGPPEPPGAVDPASGAVLRADEPVRLGAAGGADCLVLQGRPIAEPVAQYGPFVMNTRAEIQQAFDDYQRTGFGGWPWPADGPVHGTDPARFARHADGRRESAPA